MASRRFSIVLVLVLITAMAGFPAVSGRGAAAAADPERELYDATVDSETLKALQDAGYDIAAVEETDRGARASLVLTPRERNDLRRKGGVPRGSS